MFDPIGPGPLESRDTETLNDALARVHAPVPVMQGANPGPEFRAGAAFPFDSVLPFWARISVNETGGEYSWVEVIETAPGTWADKTNGRSGGSGANTAYELNGNATVVVGTRVRMFHGFNTSTSEGTVYIFSVTGSPTSQFGHWEKYTITHADFTAVAQSQILTIRNLNPAETVIVGIIKHTTAYSGGGIGVFNQTLFMNGTQFSGTIDAVTAPSNTNFKTGFPASEAELDTLITFGANSVTLFGIVDAGNTVDEATAGVTDIYLFIADPTSASSPGGNGYVLIQDEGVALTQRTTLNFVGGIVTASDDTTRTKVLLPNYGGTPPNVGASASAGGSANLSRDDHVHGLPIIDWAITMGSSGSISCSGINGEIIIQTSTGAPVHSASEGVPYWDSTNNHLYVNNNGSTGWTNISTASAAYNRIQEEGSDLTQRQTLNFVGGIVTAADDTTRTTVTLPNYATTGDIADVGGTESAGVSSTVARGDHVHALTTINWDITIQSGSDWVFDSGSTVTFNGTVSIPSVPTWKKYHYSYTDFSDGGTTKTLNLNLAAREILTGIVIKHSTAFGGGSITSYSITALISDGSTDFGLTSLDVFQAVGNLVLAVQDPADDRRLPTFAGSVMKFTAQASHALNTATAGEVDIWLETAILPAP